jgi:hypothetical protein
MTTLKVRLPETIELCEDLHDVVIVNESVAQAITNLLAQALEQGDATWTPENHLRYRQAKAGLDDIFCAFRKIVTQLFSYPLKENPLSLTRCYPSSTTSSTSLTMGKRPCASMR